MNSERRAVGVQRIPVDTVVEICGRDAQVPAFEADAVELSGRGMQVRTEYLPELNAPLVLRFEDRGREVLVEGEVAWRKQGENTGEFGIRFTALDSKSVEVLREMCGTQLKSDAPAHASPAESAGGAPGSPVKLHIEGLNAPMKARVRDSNGRRMKVGSSLEFLKVGRCIEVEDVEQGDRRDAKIDSVTVAIDPQTQVPQLVVALRYAGEITPEPSVVDSEQAQAELEELGASAEDGAGWDDIEEGSPAPEALEDDAISDEPDSPLKQRFTQTAERLGALARQSGASMGAMGAQASEGLGRLAQGLGERIAAFRAERMAQRSQRRTAGAPSSLRPEARRVKLQPQHRGSLRPQRGEPLKGSTGGSSVRMIGGVLLLIGGTVGATLALSRGGKEQSQQSAEVAAQGAVAPQVPAAAPVPAAPQPAAPAQSDPTQGIVADVPLFGPTTLATAQPEPLAAAPAEMEYEDTAPDQAFDEAPAKSSPGESSEVKPEDVKPWGKGRLHLPTVHRLRLDKPGAALKGFAKSNGFSVLIAGRKVMDNAKVISKRDDRIIEVKSDVTPDGAVVTFRFRGPVPTHKVRLRNDYVEFFISAPGGLEKGGE